MSLSGSFASMSMADLIQWARTARREGVITVPLVAIGMDALQRLTLTPADGFVVSRIDGRLSVADVLRISSLSELDALRTFKRLLGAKVIDFPFRRR
jgi:hypothetical protein